MTRQRTSEQSSQFTHTLPIAGTNSVLLSRQPRLAGEVERSSGGSQGTNYGMVAVEGCKHHGGLATQVPLVDSGTLGKKYLQQNGSACDGCCDE